MARIKVYSTGRCPICEKTKVLLKKWHISYEEALIDQDQALFQEFMRVTEGARMVPQLTLDGHWIGGFSELTEMHMDGALDELMEK